ncbi:MAG TPA: cell envelope integrity protein TolA, partial [Saprospiraceae bacterium]|nr:cell envelope integrity protein TolA [Saprospiraceae bacterium]
MRSIQFALLLLPLLIPAMAHSQCEALITEDRVIEGTHVLRTINQTLVVRGNYTYSLELRSDNKGITAKMFSKAGVEFNQDDEIIFMDENTVRRSYRFIDMGEVITEGGTPVYYNILQLDLGAIQWFANSNITTLYIKNNISKEMRKFTINDSRKAEFSQLVACFSQKLDRSKVNDVELTDNVITVAPSPKSEDKQGAATPPGKARPAANPADEAEVNALRQELQEVKERLRQEIAAEKARAEEIKSRLQQEVALAQENAAAQKKKYADEVVEARQKSQEEI